MLSKDYNKIIYEIDNNALCNDKSCNFSVMTNELYNEEKKIITILSVECSEKNREFLFLKNVITQQYFGLSEDINKAFKGYKGIVMDEADDSIHPLILAKIIEMFKIKGYNKKNVC